MKLGGGEGERRCRRRPGRRRCRCRVDGPGLVLARRALPAVQGVEKEPRQHGEAVRGVPAVQERARRNGDAPGSGGGDGAASPRRPPQEREAVNDNQKGAAVIAVIIIAVIGGYVLV